VSPTSTNNVTIIDTKRGLTPRAEGRAGSGDADPVIRARLAALLDKAAGRGAEGILELGLKEEFAGKAAIVSSFGAESAVLLHMVAQIDPATPILFLNTGKLFGETLRYRDRLQDELGLADAVEMAGSVTHEELIAYYDGCDVFLCLSNHEGFCVPLLESMYHRLPIVSYRNTAVPETVQQAGLILPDKEPARVAAAIHRVVEDARLRGELAAAAAERVDWFALSRVQDGFVAALEAACAA